MSTNQELEKTGKSFLGTIQSLVKKIKPIHVAYAVVPILLIYPKPLMYILKPIIRKWSFHYRRINQIASKPTELILTSNRNLSFEKQYIKNFKVIKGTLPQSFKLISESLLDQEQLRLNQDQSMKHVFIKKKYEFQKEKIFTSCYIIDMEDTFAGIQKDTSHLNCSLNIRKNSHGQFLSPQEKKTDHSIYTQTDYIWVEMILMKLKLLQLQNNCEAIKHVIIKANEKVIRLLQAKILGIKQSQVFKLGLVGQNKIHVLKLNKILDTYEHCSATFKIQQKQTSKPNF